MRMKFEIYNKNGKEVFITGLTVDEIIEKLKDLSAQGYGDRIVLDRDSYGIVSVGLAQIERIENSAIVIK